MKSYKFLSLLLVLIIGLSTFSIPALALENNFESNDDTIFADNADTTSSDEETEKAVADEEAIKDFVTRLYSICLNREPDSIGLDGWTKSLVDKQATGCKFLGSIALTNYGSTEGTFRDCEFENLTMSPCVGFSNETILFENCIINSGFDTFMKIGPNNHTEGNINLIFKNCEINHTGKTFITIEALFQDNSSISFDGCTINKEVDTSVAPDLIRVG